MGRLENKIAVVTGASSGMGRAVAKRFAAEGAAVVAVARRTERLEALKAEVEATGGKLVVYAGDLTEKEICYGCVEHAINTFGKIDILANVAGDSDYNMGIAALDDADWETNWNKVMRLDMDAYMYTTRKAVQFMAKNGGGAIVNIASTCGLVGGGAGTAYTTAKHGVIGMTKNVGFLYAQDNVRCNCVCPGGVTTEILERFTKRWQDKTLPDPQSDARATFGQARFTRMGTPEDIANACLILVEDDASFITGAILAADAGAAAY